jgi:hypothetical protein
MRDATAAPQRSASNDGSARAEPLTGDGDGFAAYVEIVIRHPEVAAEGGPRRATAAQVGESRLACN